MCLIFGLEQAYWNLAGVSLEIAGFLLVFVPPLRELMEANRVSVFGRAWPRMGLVMMAQGDKEKLVASKNWISIRPLALGASFVVLGLAAQLPGNWPC